MKIKRVICILLILIIFPVSAYASVLGSEQLFHAEVEFAPGAVFNENVFYSDQSGIGKQSEYYFEYTPNESVVPVIVNGDYMSGRTKINAMDKWMSANGKNPVMLMNADFFSLQTGVPMSHCIEDGEILTKDGSGQDAIGFREDGSAFIGWLDVYTTVYANNQAITINNVNKYRQPYSIYMLTDRYGKTTQAEGSGINVVIGQLSDKLIAGKTINGVVEAIIPSEGEIDIEPGKIILTVDDRVDASIMSQMDNFKIGETVYIESKVTGDERWSEAKHIMGCYSGRLIKNGNIVDTDEAAAPRTAIGIKADGNIIFYVLDGRRPGHSYGARRLTLAKRLLELGCVDAVNLDGGGSTSMMGAFPGKSESEIINTPSDGSVRAVSNFVSLVNTKIPTGKLSKLYLYPYGGYYLSGAVQEFNALGVDDAYYPADIKENVTYSVTNGGAVDANKITIQGSGAVTVSASTDSGITGSQTYYSVDNPDKITIRNKKTNKEIQSASLMFGESIDLGASAHLGNIELVSQENCFTWSLAGDVLGTLNGSTFTAGDKPGVQKIKITAGKSVRFFDITIIDPATIGYSEAEFGQAEDAITLKISNTNEATVNTDSLLVKMDGEEVSYEFDGSCVRIPLPDDNLHKFSVQFINSNGKTSVFYHTAKGIVENELFADIAEHWASNTIKYMNNQAIVNGTKVGENYYFYPASNMTRGEFAVMIANYMRLNLDDYENTDVPYSDSASLPSWAIRQIKALYREGIIQGKSYPDGTVRFDHQSSITRAEAITIISRLLPDGLKKDIFSANDLSDIPDWAMDSFKTAVTCGLVSGYDDNTLKPLNNVTRAEAVQMLYNIY